jgi:hypothetical protein
VRPLQQEKEKKNGGAIHPKRGFNRRDKARALRSQTSGKECAEGRGGYDWGLCVERRKTPPCRPK